MLGCGGHTFGHRPWLAGSRDENIPHKKKLLPAKDHILYMVSGAANGIDTMADAWATEHGILMINYRAEGVDKYSSKKKWGKALLLRNTVIVNDCTHLLAFPHPTKSRGTWNTIRKAREMNREVSVVRYRGATFFEPDTKTKTGRQTILNFQKKN